VLRRPKLRQLLKITRCALGNTDNITPAAKATDTALTGEYYGFPLPFDVTLEIIKRKSPRRELEPVTSYLASKIGESGVPRLGAQEREYVRRFVKTAPRSHRPYVRFVFSNPAGHIRDLLVLDAGTARTVGVPPNQRANVNGPQGYAGLRVLNGPCYVYYDPVADEVNTLTPDVSCQKV